MGNTSLTSMQKVAGYCRDQRKIDEILELIEQAKKEGEHTRGSKMRTPEGKTPLGWIMYHGNAELLAAATKALPPDRGTAMDPLSFDSQTGSSPLNDFCRRLLEKNHIKWYSSPKDSGANATLVSDSDLECLKTFLQLDPTNFNDKLTRHTDPVNHLTPLQALCVLQAGDDNEKAKKAVLPLAEELLSNGAEVNPYSKGGQESDQYPGAISDLSEVLKIPGAILGYNRMPPLSLAAASGNEHMVALLIAAGADIDAVDSQGRTALIISAIYGFPECFKLLISQPGVDLKAETNMHFCTVLHYCIQQYRIREKNAVSVYIDEGAAKPVKNLIPIDEQQPIEEKRMTPPVDPKNGVDMRCMLQLLLAKNPQDRPPIALSEKSVTQMQYVFDQNKPSTVPRRKSPLYVRPFSPVCLVGFIRNVYFERNSQITMDPHTQSHGTIDEKVQDEIIELLKPHFDEEEKKRTEEYMSNQAARSASAK